MDYNYDKLPRHCDVTWIRYGNVSESHDDVINPSVVAEGEMKILQVFCMYRMVQYPARAHYQSRLCCTMFGCTVVQSCTDSLQKNEIEFRSLSRTLQLFLMFLSILIPFSFCTRKVCRLSRASVDCPLTWWLASFQRLTALTQIRHDTPLRSREPWQLSTSNWSDPGGQLHTETRKILIAQCFMLPMIHQAL